MSDLRTTPLHDRHAALGAAFTDFGGWSMPVRYGSDLAEHHAVRTAAGLFDISHMAEFLVTGSGAAAFLDYSLAGRVSAMSNGKAKYSLLLDEAGGVIDDVIVYRIADDRFLVISNAGNRDAVAAELDARINRFVHLHAFREGQLKGDFAFIAGAGAPRVEDISDQTSLIAVQGPRAREIVEATVGIADVAPALVDLGYYAWSSALFEGASLLIARTGYTGEDGFELMVPNAVAPALWDALLAAGEPLGLVPAGLASRDTLRLEAGMPLHGHELSTDILPTQAGLGRVVAADKDDFVGKEALAAASADLPVLVGLVSEGRRAGRAGYAVLDVDGTPVGEITSGALSPTLGHPIAMAFVPPALAAPGTELLIDVRGTRIPATVTALPFYRRIA
ncbi:glycine cleavage system aminomethyltransferase GcvT [Microbacterium dextranolyticum]|uniref:Aminomethyltransferase n=1 Tax=Microbacterium dextranolyticum TaxID=36806 RepID=A0A9W6HN17_9MICO|nr:glycine cleavage system aminomethyltransferase GcvT [Microbacterium dextranolyticum]MBM7463305.1 aminomethyltransferase [Microbacterium dextranolyticum]GLJ95590.1 aminomethyltransferase [Microbacterium dextranolyticum]